MHLNSLSGRDKSPVHFPASIVKNFTHKPLPPFVFLTVSKVTNGNQGIRERSLRTKLKNYMLVISTCVVALAKNYWQGFTNVHKLADQIFYYEMYTDVLVYLEWNTSQ